ncbi:MAG TPA: tetratricopeptide repeat protein [Thermoanaerobaculia bacterium]|nr:tetratricopeptide repeat protein [Thermoanaerobaculia bacterium]
MRKPFALAAILITTLAGTAFAIGEARFTGKVVDSKNKPLPGAEVLITSTGGKNFKQTYKADKKGMVNFILIDGTLKYKMTVSKEGFVPYVEMTKKFKLIPESNEQTITLASGTVTPSGTTIQVPQPEKVDLGVAAYNEGAALANAGDTDGAILKFEAAVAAKPTLTSAYIALAKMYTNKKLWAKVIDNGNKALAIIGEDPDVAVLLAQAYDKSGDKVKASEFRKKAPADPTSLFNEAARSINAGKDSDAEKLLVQALTADEKFAAAHYELGMIYVRSSKNADARKHLQKYIELEPKGKDVATAKEMLNYVK